MALTQIDSFARRKIVSSIPACTLNLPKESIIPNPVAYQGFIEHLTVRLEHQYESEFLEGSLLPVIFALNVLPFCIKKPRKQVPFFRKRLSNKNKAVASAIKMSGTRQHLYLIELDCDDTAIDRKVVLLKEEKLLSPAQLRQKIID